MVSSSEGKSFALFSSETPANFAHLSEPSFVICCGVRMPATTSSP